jgi:hypothetical protein
MRCAAWCNPSICDVYTLYTVPLVLSLHGPKVLIHMASDIYVHMCTCMCVRNACVCMCMYACVRMRMCVRVHACAYNVEFEILSGVGDTNWELHMRLRFHILY